MSAYTARRRGARAVLVLAGMLACVALATRTLRAPPPTTPAEAAAAAAAVLRTCTSLKCLQRVHAMPGPRQFEFPHFLIIGWAKCGTTSLHRHLAQHPQISPPRHKEPQFFSRYCPKVVERAGRCHTDWWPEEAYVSDLLGAANATSDTWRRAAYEGSTSYSDFGARVAPAVRAALPWVRIVALLREPVSRAVSWLFMTHEKYRKHGVDDPTGEVCLDAGSDAGVFPCMEATMQRLAYGPNLAEWLRAFPASQLFVIQFEQMTGSGGARVLRDVHAFLGLDPPAEHRRLPHAHNRKQRKPEGWALSRQQYQRLVDLARRDAHEVVELLTGAGLADGAAWLAEWECVWSSNLESCDAAGQCHIQVT